MARTPAAAPGRRGACSRVETSGLPLRRPIDLRSARARLRRRARRGGAARRQVLLLIDLSSAHVLRRAPRHERPARVRRAEDAARAAHPRAVPPRRRRRAALRRSAPLRRACRVYAAADVGDARPSSAVLGLDPLEPRFTRRATCATRSARAGATSRRSSWTRRRIAGLGNIYVCEALFHAGIAPERRTDGSVASAPSGCTRPSVRCSKWASSNRGTTLLATTSTPRGKPAATSTPCASTVAKASPACAVSVR